MIDFLLNRRMLLNEGESHAFRIGIPPASPAAEYITNTIIETVRQRYIDMLTGPPYYNPYVSDSYSIFIEAYSADLPMYVITACNFLVISPGASPNSIMYENDGHHFVQFYYYPSQGTLSDGNFYGYKTAWTYAINDLLSTGRGWVLDSAYDEIYSSTGQLVWKK